MTRHHGRFVGLNWGVVLPVMGGALVAVGIGMLVCAVTAALYGDGGALAFAGPGAATLAAGAWALLSGQRRTTGVLRARDGFFAVTATWALAAVVGALPLLLSGTFQRPVDAFFESMSGITGCGATIIGDVDGQAHAVLLWRSLAAWLGGVGIVILVVAIAPATGLATRVFAAESSGPSAERLTPRVATTAKIIWAIYSTLTVSATVAYLAAGMGPFDAVNHALSTVATGGFTTHTASFAAFDSLAIELVAIVFMTLGGINLAFYWRAIRGGAGIRPQLAEVRAYLGFLIVGTGLVTGSLLVAGDETAPAGALRAAGFSVVSVMTSTGFVTADFDEWNPFARLVLLALIFVGGCAGSTAGGMKVVRIMLLGKTAVQEVQRQLQPKAIQVLRLPGRVFSEEARRNVLGFFYIYVTAWLAGSLLMTAVGLDLVTASTAAAAALNVAGVGFGEVGAAENFAAVPPAGRGILGLLMLVGRLEVFTVVVLLTPAFWRREWT